MSFAGNLEDLAIVDVIQLLHSTRKSGTLCVKGDKGRSQIVFKNGFIVCANHHNDSVRIGKILVEMEAITEEDLQSALAVQEASGDAHTPLVGLLIEKQLIEKDLAYKGLECLIEMTIVEMVSWQKGTFTLDVDVVDINDEYRYIPEKLQQELTFDTQMVLLDALRIYDEKRAAGKAPSDNTTSKTDRGAQTGRQPVSSEAASPQIELSADILGLESIDQLETQIQETFSGLEAFDPSEIHRQKIRDLLPDFPALQREELVVFLTDKSSLAHNPENIDAEMSQAIIFYGSDELVRHGLLSTCKHVGIMIFSASTPQELDSKITQSLDRSLEPVLVFDCPVPTQEGFTKEEIVGLRRQMSARYPRLQIVQVTSPIDYLYSLQALTTGATVTMPRSIAENRRDSFIPDFIQFLESFSIFIYGLCSRQKNCQQTHADYVHELRQMQSASEISFFMLEQTSSLFDRSMILILRNDEFMAEKSFGIESDRSTGPSDPLRFKIPVTDDSLLAKVVESGQLFFGSVDDKIIRESIFGEISAPDKSKVLLLPLVAGERTLALIYADFGQSPVKKIDTEYLQSLAWVASLALEQVLRKRQK